MNLRWLVLLAICLITSQVGAQEAPPAAKREAPETQQSTVLPTQKEKVSYGIGVNAAQGFKRQKMDLDLEALIRGLRDGLAGNQLLISEEEIRKVLTAFQQEMVAQQAAEKKALGDKNKQEGEAFLAENQKKEGIVTLPSGLQYKIIKAGEGKIPTDSDSVEVHYRGTLIDGTEFDSSYKRSQPLTLPVKGVIPGWTEALKLMPVGSKWQLFIPPALGYGARGSGDRIGPNATLIFDVELLSIKEPKPKESKPAAAVPAPAPAPSPAPAPGPK